MNYLTLVEFARDLLIKSHPIRHMNLTVDRVGSCWREPVCYDWDHGVDRSDFDDADESDYQEPTASDDGPCRVVEWDDLGPLGKLIAPHVDAMRALLEGVEAPLTAFAPSVESFTHLNRDATLPEIAAAVCLPAKLVDRTEAYQRHLARRIAAYRKGNPGVGCRTAAAALGVSKSVIASHPAWTASPPLGPKCKDERLGIDWHMVPSGQTTAAVRRPNPIVDDLLADSAKAREMVIGKLTIDGQRSLANRVNRLPPSTWAVYFKRLQEDLKGQGERPAVELLEIMTLTVEGYIDAQSEHRSDTPDTSR